MHIYICVYTYTYSQTHISFLHFFLWENEGEVLIVFIFLFLTFKKFYWLIFREKEERGERERERDFCSSTYLCIHWLLLECSLPGNQTCNFGISGQWSNQLSYPARPDYFSITNILRNFFHIYVERVPTYTTIIYKRVFL